jgi:hypothetical protein
MTSLGDKISKAAYAPDSTLVIKDRKWLFTSYPNSFLGKEFCIWATKNKFEGTDNMQAFCDTLLKDGHIKSFGTEKTFDINNYYSFRKVKILVIGTGGAGFPIVLELQKVVHYDLTVITKEKDYWYVPSIPFSFAPGGTVWTKPITSVLNNAKLVINEVVSIEPNLVICKDGTKFDDFDYYIVATGSYYADITCKDDNVLVIKANVAPLFQSKKEAIKNAKHIVVVGSGTVGCEIFAPLCEFNPDKKFTMVTSSATVLARRNESIQKPILNHLKGLKNGTIKFGQRVSEISDGKIKTDKEEMKKQCRRYWIRVDMSRQMNFSSWKIIEISLFVVTSLDRPKKNWIKLHMSMQRIRL